MEIQPIVVGTAGHIDHGKSSLVKALTGTDPDRLKEEQERGLTIDLGFANLALPDGRVVGIVDVPGHERFVRNMVAGATGIDLVVLVVAADDGVMPQTREHLDIMQLLGISRGFVALNKVDLVDEEMAALAADDVRAAVAGTFLEGAPIVGVSATTGEGLPELRRVLSEMATETTPRSAEGVFRMPIQRVFSKRGFGTILTGIPVSGSVVPGDVLEVLPAGVRGKVRSLQAYAEPAQRGRAGHSTAINLTDVERGQAARGHVVATPGFFEPVRMVGARLRALPGLEKPIQNRTPVRLHTGTADPSGEVILLDQVELAPGAEGLVQVRLDEPVVCAPGDRFILRLSSPSVTLGGGQILEESQFRLKRFKSFVIEGLALQEGSLDSPPRLLEATLLRHRAPYLSSADLARAIKRSPEETAAILERLSAAGRALRLGDRDRWAHPERIVRDLGTLSEAIARWFTEHPLRTVIEVLELRRSLRLEPGYLDLLLDEAARRGELVLHGGGRIQPAGRAPTVDAEAQALRGRVLAAIDAGAYQPPTLGELASALGIDARSAREVVDSLVDDGSVWDFTHGLYLSADKARALERMIVENCEQHGHLELPSLRDRLATSRKFLIPLLEHFDARGLTARQGGERVLRRR
jgi:selenocysteine-specific elongation factor